MAKVRLLDPTDSKRRLDRYELIGELASGGMATVYLGRLGGVGGFQRFVAIKRLHPHLAGEEEFIEMFLDEARLAAGIHHPHVVPILEVGESESGYYLVMEYIEGDTLARIVARSVALAKLVPRPVLVRILLDALAGLHAAHELTDTDDKPVHLVHRDVSPQNILVGVDGCSRITDFGVAHAASRLSNTRADKLKGKLAYMAPEQARAADVDRRVDVFAMGIILWEVLALKRLFKADNEVMTLQRILVEPIPRLAQVAPHIHPAFDQVCAKALERDPDRRYRSAAEMAESLERAARTAASTSPTDLGVASPREVAAYVQGALGEDIAAQRESVRAWLAHSEPSMPRISAGGFRPTPDVTVKVPLDRPSPSASGPASSSSPSVPSSSRTIAEAAEEPEMEPHEGVPDDDEHETLLMDRDAQSAVSALGLVPSAPMPVVAPPSSKPAPVAPPPSTASRRAGFHDEGTPSASLDALAIPPSPPRRTRKVVAIAAAILAVAGGFAAWTQLRAPRQAPVEPPKPVTAPSATASSAPSAAETSVPSATATASSAALDHDGGVGRTPPNPPEHRGPTPVGGKWPPKARSSAEPSKPPEPAKPPPDLPKPPDDMSNPYR